MAHYPILLGILVTVEADAEVPTTGAGWSHQSAGAHVRTYVVFSKGPSALFPWYIRGLVMVCATLLSGTGSARFPRWLCLLEGWSATPFRRVAQQADGRQLRFAVLLGKQVGRQICLAHLLGGWVGRSSSGGLLGRLALTTRQAG
jgi:hypothetical protein